MASPDVDGQLSKEAVMDKEHIKGAADKAKGAVKDAAGRLMDDKGLQVEGKMDKEKGAAREALGEAKDAGRNAPDREACQVLMAERAAFGPPFLRHYTVILHCNI